MMMRTYLLLVIVLMALCACGFQMRGSDVLLENYQTVSVKGVKNTPFAKALKRALAVRGVEVIESSTAADAVLTINEDNSGQRVLSVAVTEGPEEYEVFQTTQFSLSKNGKTSIDAQSITLTRDYTYDKNDILGKRHEYESLRQALAEEMAQTILRRMQYAF